ncbi:MAG: hypothetical protein A2139_05410 [Desulfobacca sp. RBG_16_60_12]|nr:MAG: hypothetical protein A2139_05410 [Desulfobacca sp. RBG_16_60_12]
MRGYFVAIPTYWTHPGGEGPGAIVFDHPTPLDTPGTLRRTLESLTPLAARGVEVDVSVVAAATAPALEAAVARRVREVIESPPLPYPVRLFAAPHLSILQDFCRTRGRAQWLPLLSLAGYSQIRNITLILANICGARALLSLDDDEVVANPDFLAKVEEDLELLGREHPVFGLAGIYRNQDGGVLLPEPAAPWAGYWPKMRWLNAALKELVLAGPRLKPTYLGFGGNLALPAALFRRLPFDPAITRGEDTDYLLNARMFEIPFFLDNALSIIHLPPDKPHPTWLRLRQDLVRFCYTRLKLRQQEPAPGRAVVTAEELKPYPGNFLTDDLPDRAFRSHTLLALDYLAQGDAEAARQTLENLALMNRLEQAGAEVYREFLSTVSLWQALQDWLATPEVAAGARQALWGAA